MAGWIAQTNVTRRWAQSGLTAVFLVSALLTAGPGAVAQSTPSPPSPASSAPAAPSFGVRAALTGLTTLEKNHFAYAVAAGTTIRDAVIVSNFTDKPLTFKMYGTDLITAQGGGLAPLNEGVASRLVGTWIVMSKPELTIPPHQELTDPFTLAVPPGTQSGDFLGAVVAGQQAAPGSGIQVLSRGALIARVTVPGAVNLGVSPGPLRGEQRGGDELFSLPILNTGNVLFTFTGEVVVRDEAGRVLVSLPVSPQDIYVIPGGTATVKATWHGVPSKADVTALATVHATLNGQPAGDFRSNTIRLSFSPGPPTVAGLSLPVIGAIAGGLGLLVILALILLYQRRRCACDHCHAQVARRSTVAITNMADVSECTRCLRVILSSKRVTLCPSCLKRHLLQAATSR